MSYAHTKRRKNIARWKRTRPKIWRTLLEETGLSVRKRQAEAKLLKA